jgi:hypothetical protein
VRLGIVLLLVASVSVVPTRPTGAADAADAAVPSYRFDGSISSGYRTVDIDGSKDKYREDYDLRSGGRLFSLATSAVSSTPEATPLDRFRLEVETPGDEPYSNFRLAASDRGRFDLSARFTRSRYFYAVPELFQAPVPEVRPTDDLHDFDVVRVNGAVDLTLRAGSLPPLRLGYRLYDRDAGNRRTTSTVRIPGGDTFLVRAPSSSVANVVLAGTTLRLFDASVSLEQRYRWTDRSLKLHDPLDPAGVDPTDGSTLDRYDAREKDTIDTPMTTVRVERAIGERAEVAATYFFSHANMDVDQRRMREGTSNVPAFSGDTRATASGDGTLTTNVADVSATVRLSERLRVHTAYRFDERSQDGRVGETGTFGDFVAKTDDLDRSHSVSTEIEVEPRADLLLGAGMRYRSRHLDLGLTPDVTTDTISALGRIRYRPRPYLDLFARYENIEIDDPLTVPGDSVGTPTIPDRETLLTFVNRGTVGVRLLPWTWGELSYQLIADNRENDTFDGRAWTLGNGVAVTVTPLAGLTVMASYTRRDLDNRTDILVAPLYTRTISEQDGTENVVTSTLRYDFGVVGQRWSGGGTFSWFDSDSTLKPRLETGGGTHTRYDLDRFDSGVFLTLLHDFLEPTIEFRYIDYAERPLTDNDYRATIVVLRATKRFSF